MPNPIVKEPPVKEPPVKDPKPGNQEIDIDDAQIEPPKDDAFKKDEPPKDS